MRKIISREERENQTKRNQLIIGIILIGIILFSSLGYAFNNGDDDRNSKKIEYKGITFIQDESGYWNFNIKGQNFITRYNPQETENISFFSMSSIGNYANKPLYLVSDFNEPNFEIYRNMLPLVQRINEACFDEDCENEKDLPIKNCSVDNVIIIKEPEGEIMGNETKENVENIYQEESCVFINAGFENQTRYADVFLFKILGV